MSNPNRSQAQAIAERHPSLIRPEQLSSLGPMNAEHKAKLQGMVTGLWNVLATKSEDDQAFKAALTRLEEVSGQVVTLVQRQRLKQQQGGQGFPQAAMNNAAGNAQAQAQANRPAGQAGQPNAGPTAATQQTTFSKNVVEAVQKFQFYPPQEAPLGSDAAKSAVSGYRHQYALMLNKMEKIMAAANQVTSQQQQHNAQNPGKQLPEALQTRLKTVSAQRDQVRREVNAFQALMAQNKTALESANNAAAAGAGGKPAVSVNTAVANAVRAAGVNAGTPGSAAAASSAFKQTPLSASTSHMDAARAAAANRASASPISASHPQGPGFPPTSTPQQARLGPQQLQRPGLNTQQPVQTMPASAAGSNPVALSQAAALVRARTYSEEQGRTQQGAFAQSSSGQSTPSTQLKHAIPRTLPDTAMAPPLPVNMPPPRPTLSNVGTLNQPAITRQPVFHLEGEGTSRALSKKKLDELVRQVTGGTETLSPEVEEMVMEITDEFVDNVITASCRLAKLRPDKTLEIRDLQTVLERNYHIRIPGYSLDETRVVRRVQPAPSWQAKMNAINAARVMNGKTDA